MDINKYKPKYCLQHKHLLRLAQLSTEEIFEILYTAKIFKQQARVEENPPILKNKTVALLFDNVSTRTRITFELGIRQLGGHFIYLPRTETQLSRGENMQDTAAMMSRYGLAAVVLRGFESPALDEFARYSEIPVINGLSSDEHPLQILSDLLTIWEKKGQLDNLKLAYVGDGNNIANSLIIGCSKVNMDIAIASPGGYSPDREIVERGMQFSNVTITDDVKEAVRDADIVYTDVFISMNEQNNEEKKQQLSRYRVTPEMMKLAKSDALFMHCMPVHRGEEVAAEVADGPQSIIYEQAENRLHMNKTILSMLVRHH